MELLMFGTYLYSAQKSKHSDWNKSSDEKKMPKFINVVTGIRTNRWEKMLKINKRSATFIRYWSSKLDFALAGICYRL